MGDVGFRWNPTRIRSKNDRIYRSDHLPWVLVFWCIISRVSYIYSMNISIEKLNTQRLVIEQLIRVIMVSMYNLNYPARFYFESVWLLLCRSASIFFDKKMLAKLERTIYCVRHNQINPLTQASIELHSDK